MGNAGQQQAAAEQQPAATAQEDRAFEVVYLNNYYLNSSVNISIYFGSVPGKSHEQCRAAAWGCHCAGGSHM